MSKVYYVNGEYVSADEATLPITDLAVVRGYGVFDFLRTYNGIPIHLPRNIQRLRRSAGIIQLDVPWTDEEIREIVLETLRRNAFDESNIRIIVTGGSSPTFLMPDDAPRLLVYVEPLSPLPEVWYTEGVTVVTFHEERYLPGSKSLNYIPAIIAMKKARAADAVEALYVDNEAQVREGTTTNVFAFYGNRVVTPEEGILPGITRGAVLGLIRDVYEVEERPLPLNELLQADEILITAANKQVVPVVQVNDTAIGDGQVGERAQKVMALFAEYTQQMSREMAASS